MHINVFKLYYVKLILEFLSLDRLKHWALCFIHIYRKVQTWGLVYVIVLQGTNFTLFALKPTVSNPYYCRGNSQTMWVLPCEISKAKESSSSRIWPMPLSCYFLVFTQNMHPFLSLQMFLSSFILEFATTPLKTHLGSFINDTKKANISNHLIELWLQNLVWGGGVSWWLETVYAMHLHVPDGEYHWNNFSEVRINYMGSLFTNSYSCVELCGGHTF